MVEELVVLKVIDCGVALLKMKTAMDCAPSRYVVPEPHVCQRRRTGRQDDQELCRRQGQAGAKQGKPNPLAAPLPSARRTGCHHRYHG